MVRYHVGYVIAAPGRGAVTANNWRVSGELTPTAANIDCSVLLYGAVHVYISLTGGSGFTPEGGAGD